ncbi:MAG: hypothetical protein LQ343_001162 [Gyalolechia ehrenbergii]|nr:MAG: hypothetical protein LQ343_001162 [Gyalolechia ehrenbergii]
MNAKPSTPTGQLQLATTPPSLRHTYATESSIADRVGWHEKFTDVMNRRMWKKGQEPLPSDESPEKPGTEVQGQPQRPYQEPTSVVDDPDYTPAVSGEGLEMIGGPTGWWEEAWDEQHQYRGFMRSTPLNKGTEIWAAIERALVEAVTLAQGPRRLRRLVENRPRSLKVAPIGDFNLSQADNGEFTLQWRRQEDETDLRIFLYKSALKNKEFQDSEQRVDGMPVQDEADEDVDKVTLSEPDNGLPMTSSMDPAADSDHRRAAKDWTSLERTEDRLSRVAAMQIEDKPLLEAPVEEPVFTQAKELGENRYDESRGIIRFVDPETLVPAQAKEPAEEQYTRVQKGTIFTGSELKFSVLKRVMQLTGKRIPDPAIQAIKSPSDLYNELIKKPKPKKLAEVLERGIKRAPSLTSLPNVRVVPYRQKPYMAESALGRKKVIERRLDEHGIREPFRDAMEMIELSERKRLLSKWDAG